MRFMFARHKSGGARECFSPDIMQYLFLYIASPKVIAAARVREKRPALWRKTLLCVLREIICMGGVCLLHTRLFIFSTIPMISHATV